MTNPPAEERPRGARAGRRVGRAALLPRLLWAALVALAWAAIATLSAAAVVHASALRSWPFELVHHFVPTYVTGAAIVLLFGLSVRHLRLTAAAALLFGFFIWALAMPIEPGLYQPPAVLEAQSGPPSSLTSPPPVSTTGPGGAQLPSSGPFDPGAQERTLSVITNNVFCGNWDREGLERWIRSRPADVVVLQEVPTFLNKALVNLGEAYPYEARIVPVHSEKRGKIGACQGIVVLSIYPIASARVFQPIEDTWPAMVATLEIDATTRASLAVVHAADPIRADGLRWRDQFLRQLAALLNTMHGPLIVLGDFNASPFTPAFRAFQVDAGLELSPWTPATYPSRLETFGISIDHVLVLDANLLRVDPLPAIGSDHRPVRASIAVPTARGGVTPGLADGAGNRVERAAAPDHE